MQSFVKRDEPPSTEVMFAGAPLVRTGTATCGCCVGKAPRALGKWQPDRGDDEDNSERAGGSPSTPNILLAMRVIETEAIVSIFERNTGATCKHNSALNVKVRDLHAPSRSGDHPQPWTTERSQKDTSMPGEVRIIGVLQKHLLLRDIECEISHDVQR
jgi:hypothetical protein